MESGGLASLGGQPCWSSPAVSDTTTRWQGPAARTSSCLLRELWGLSLMMSVSEASRTELVWGFALYLETMPLSALQGLEAFLLLQA